MKKVRVKIFDEEHEEKLEKKVNEFLDDITEKDFIDIKYGLSTLFDMKSQVYCFTAMVIYKK